jgi:hypothetical protein
MAAAPESIRPLVVFDLDECMLAATALDASGTSGIGNGGLGIPPCAYRTYGLRLGNLFVAAVLRPKMMRVIAEIATRGHCDVAIWSAGTQDYVRDVVGRVVVPEVNRKCTKIGEAATWRPAFVWSCQELVPTGRGMLAKDLRAIECGWFSVGRRMCDIMLVDDNPWHIAHNRELGFPCLHVASFVPAKMAPPEAREAAAAVVASPFFRPQTFSTELTDAAFVRSYKLKHYRYSCTLPSSKAPGAEPRIGFRVYASS